MKVPILLVVLSLTFLTSCGLLGGGGHDKNRPDIPGKLVFSAKDAAGTSQIYTMQANGAALKQITQFSPDAGGYEPSWSPDGRQIVFSTPLRSSSNGFSLYLMNADGTNMHPLHERKGSTIPTPGSHPDWSADGGKITWDHCVNCQAATDIAIFVYDFSTDSVTQLTTHTPNQPVSDTNPVWSPDGQRIAFASNRDTLKEGGTDIYLINSTGNNIIRLTKTGNAGRQLWYANGQKLLYWSKNKLYELNLADMQSTNIIVQLSGDTGFRPFAISPKANYVLLLVFSYANPQAEQSLQILNLNSKKLINTYSNAAFNGADWFVPASN